MLEVLEGVAPFARAEVEAVGFAVVTEAPTELRVSLPDEDLTALTQLRCVVAAYASITFDVVRPRSLLSPERLTEIAEAIDRIRSSARLSFDSLRLRAAGSDSADLQRLRDALSRATGLRDDPDAGDLVVRLRRSPTRGWEVLLRLTPRPLSARPWRTERYEGSLNGTIAAAIVRQTQPQASDRFLDLMCGAGTLLIERLSVGLPARAVGVDISPDALEATRVHLRGARIRGARVELIQSDIRELDVADRFDKIVANPPWGTLVGSHAENDELYPAILGAAACLATSDGLLLVLTHDIARFDAAVAVSDLWHPAGTTRFFQKGHRPKLYTLRRSRT